MDYLCPVVMSNAIDCWCRRRGEKTVSFCVIFDSLKTHQFINVMGKDRVFTDLFIDIRVHIFYINVERKSLYGIKIM